MYESWMLSLTLRLCTINPRLTESDIAAMLERLDSRFRTLMAAQPNPH